MMRKKQLTNTPLQDEWVYKTKVHVHVILEAHLSLYQLPGYSCTVLTDEKEETPYTVHEHLHFLVA